MTEDDAAQAPAYSYKPSLLGAAWQFRLTPGGLSWEIGRRSGLIPFRDIRCLRMALRPTTMQARCFTTEIWPPSGPKLTIASTTWKSMVEHASQAGPYREFVIALHRRVAEANGKPLFLSGVAPFLYWPGLCLFVVASLGLAALTVRALQSQAWTGAAFVGGFLALFLYQLGAYFRRNRPGHYHPEALPPDLLPPA